MTKSTILATLLSLWLFAIFAPPLISFLCDNGQSVVSFNLNEEEQQEQGKKSFDEKLIVHGKTSDFYLLSKLQGSISYDFYLLKNSDHTSEIILPPPEYLV